MCDILRALLPLKTLIIKKMPLPIWARSKPAKHSLNVPLMKAISEIPLETTHALEVLVANCTSL